ncbi:nucleoporin nup49 [Diplocarpon rosae]|nr:nucleoporin nup49 [Diplocarpon rosae]
MSQNSQSSETEDEGLLPLEYARQNGLSRDYLREPLGIPELQELQRRENCEFRDNATLHRHDLGEELQFEERLTCSKEAALLLSWVAQEAHAQEIKALVDASCNTPTGIRKMKFDLPLLRTDHETDCRDFASRDGFEIKLRDVKFPLEAVGDGEGFDWVIKFESLAAGLLQDLRHEKLGVTRDAMAYLQEIPRPVWTEEDEKILWEREQNYGRKAVPEPVTPPLSPLPVKHEPFEPDFDDPVFQLPVLSDPISPTKQDLEAIEKDLFQQDVPTPLRSVASCDKTLLDEEPRDAKMTLGEVYPPLASLDNSPVFNEEKRIKPEDLKVEGPMTPQFPAAAFKSVRFSNIIEHLDIEALSNPNTPAGQSTFFKDAFGPAYSSANQQLEQETLIRADTTARVDVPLISFQKPEPPWYRFEQVKDSAALLALQKSFVWETVASSIPTWPGSRQQDIKLRWNPFTSDFAKFAFEEDFPESETAWHNFVRDEQDVIDSTSLAWKPSGIKILKDGRDDDDEIDSGSFQKNKSQDLSSLVKKRRMELQARENLRKISPAQDLALSGAGEFTATKKPKPDSGGGEFRFLDGIFSAENSLDHYLELRGTKRAKGTDSNYFANRGKTTSVQPDTGGCMQPIVVPPSLPIRKSPLARKENLPVPSLDSPNNAINIIASSTLLKSRGLIRQIESRLPTLKLVERDFTTHNTSAWLPGTVARSPVKSPLDAEADIIVSPTVGIILTTLQIIKQRPLPGPTIKLPAIRERIEKVSPRYEKLIVFVSEGSLDESTNGLNENDCLALAEFIGYTSGFVTPIIVQFIGGSDKTLSQWLASAITQYRVDTELLPEETHWELFLRRAGLNAFAAQTIIGELKAPNGVNMGSLTKAGMFGITAFVEMSREERVLRLGGLCGRAVLERVGAGIDASWQ